MPRPPRPQEIVVADPDALAAAVADMAAFPVLGFDTEFVGEHTYRPALCLVQVATPTTLYLLDPLTCGPLDAFWEVVADPARTAVVHAGREEMRMCVAGIGRPPATVFDVQIAAALVGHSYPIGYGAIVNEALAQRARKGETLTDWRRRPLTPAQMQYAYDDVRFLLPLHAKLSDQLAKLGREAWAGEEFAAFVRRSVADDPAVERWRKVKGLGGLDRRSLATARELFAWRDSVAARQNRPPRSVLRDEMLSEIARRRPTDAADVLALRGLAKADVPPILDAVRRAAELPPEELPEVVEREFDQPHVQLLTNLLGVVLSEWAARNRVAANLIANPSDLRELVRGRQPGNAPPTDGPFAGGWRRAAALPELDAFLDGRRTLAVGDPADPHPLRVVDAAT